MILSILIATIPERAVEFAALQSEIQRQAKGLPVEVVTDNSPRGTLSIGAKRQAMTEKAKGAYVVHIDDDDWIATDYVSSITKALDSGPDCVGFYELVEGMADKPQLSLWSIRVPRWAEGGAYLQRHGVYYMRTPFHKTPIKREHVLSVGFKDMPFAEDHDFSKRLQAKGLCKREAFIPRVMYHYRYKLEDHNTKYGIKA